APVRVASDGDQTAAAGPGPATGGGQSAGDSTGSLQVGAPVADLTTRALSEGDDEAGAPSGQDAAVQGSTGSVQVGGPRVRSALRVASAGDSRTVPTATESVVFAGPAPTVGIDEGSTGRADRGRGSRPAPNAGGAFPENAGGNAPGATSGPGSLVPAAYVAATGAAGELPRTGLALMWLLGLGLALTAGGAALRRSAFARGAAA
ncbi:MAG TPA: hypothetical protein VFY44_03220, partial [Thermoleophilaceae bacterium]|nr:hypothetical protein [Thermoleophilaceae bacterium]